MKLYSYYLSSAAYRVRIALALKGIDHETQPVDLRRDGGEHRTESYRAVNPQMRVPALALDDGTVLIQSPAILEYLEETRPNPPLLPRDAEKRAKVRALAAIVGCDIHPLNNSGTLAWLREEMGQDEDAVSGWYAQWVRSGFEAMEGLVEPGPYAFGDAVTLADLYIVPQMANARRYSVPVDDFPKLLAIDAACRTLPAFRAAAPENQPEAPGS